MITEHNMEDHLLLLKSRLLLSPFVLSCSCTSLLLSEEFPSKADNVLLDFTRVGAFFKPRIFMISGFLFTREGVAGLGAGMVLVSSSSFFFLSSCIFMNFSMKLPSLLKVLNPESSMLVIASVMVNVILSLGLASL